MYKHKFCLRINVASLLLSLSLVLSLNKTFDSIFPVPISLVLLFCSALLFNTSFKRSSFKLYLIFLMVITSLTTYHLFFGYLFKVDRFLVLVMVSFCFFLYISATARKTGKLFYYMGKIISVFLYGNFLFGLLQILGLVDPFSFSKSHMHGFGKLSGISRNSFIFSEPSYNVVATILSYIFLNEINSYRSKKLNFSIIRYRHFTITLITLLTTLSITGLISIILMIFYKAKLKSWKTYVFVIIGSLSFTFLIGNEMLSALFTRITYLTTNPDADNRLHDHIISLTSERNALLWLFGNGVGNWFEFVTNHSKLIVHKTSNSILADYVVETGLLGFTTIVSIYVLVCRKIKLIIIYLTINLFFQLHLSAIGLLAF